MHEILDKILTIFFAENLEFFSNVENLGRAKSVEIVDLVKSFPTSIWLRNLASIVKRTSPQKFGKSELDELDN